MLKALCCLSVCIGKNTTYEFLNEPVWYNKAISVNRKSIFKRRMFELGIHIINDLIDSDGKFLSFNQYCILFGYHVNF